jgi:hypothetical protein
MRIDSSGNVGIGVTPSSWASGDTILQIKAGSGTTALWGRSSTGRLLTNAYYDGSNYRYSSTASATSFENNTANGSFVWSNASSGSSGTVVSFSESMRINSSGNLLVGTTNDLPAISNVQGIALSSGSYGGRLEASRSGGAPVCFNRLENGSIVEIKKAGVTSGIIGAVGTQSYIHGGGTDVGIYFGSNNLYPYRQAGLNDATIDLGQGSKRFKDAYLSGGIYLGGTGSANKLDDYEEGSFLPTYLGDTSNPSVTYQSARKGVYVKVGDIVHISIFIEISALASNGSGGLEVGNLPFTSSGTIYQAGTIGYASGWDTDKTPTRCLVIPNSTKIALYYQSTSDPRSPTTRVQAGDLSTQSQVYLQVSYRLT